MDDLAPLLAVLVLIADLLAILHVWSRRIEFGRKIIWSLVIALLPVVGLIMWGIAAGRFAKVRL
ncbi:MULTISPECIES: PLDc N-terminal domain-containing protein [Pseudomonadaceae]|jgi:hypothetical protein|uniref:Cardiolipin synthase N-terminal domain-containing protein n=1 Tax=Pseudomonas saudiphocaensis TaxID=1499686 RepID=A0A078LUF2_9PSED|nr:MULTISPECIES: PLDc N-terminal domain-containing protein [Pseudomonadaceae]MBE7926787.1 PLDc_N domain-containing protein [Pseudomonas saudiphocaensis]MCF6783656.1 PLD nuclease N-terminal domain-containing protein [Stutzerimonas stutzeri]MCF6806506.1 PLD nuclease N-terminal domain-containing protein [Stutzerimonas stutzeri]RRV12131.1 PLDc_N domain-containing protein [Pseudomonas saudiphocaensis]CDZ93917.1 hypothetical protein BN1079_01222 [Pseudomonas saudiphocaensis]